MRDINDLQQSAPSDERKKLEENVRNRYLTDLTLILDEHKKIRVPSERMIIFRFDGNPLIHYHYYGGMSEAKPVSNLSLGDIIIAVERWQPVS